MVGPLFDPLNNPLGVVQFLFEKACAGGAPPESSNHNDCGAKMLFDNYLYRDGGYKQVPEINSVSLSAIPANSLVRFRGLVQDIFDPEFYIGTYKDGDVWRTTKFSDAYVPLTPIRAENKFFERRILYCVPVPGENDWVKQAFLSSSLCLITGDSSVSAAPPNNHSEKRTRETVDNNDVEMDLQTNVDLVDSKRLKGGISPVENPSLNLNLNMPLGKSTLSPCIVKVYDIPDGDFKLNDIIEVTGVLTFDSEQSVRSFSTSADENPFMDEGLLARLPGSRVPRLHSLTYRKLSAHKMHEAFPGADGMDAIVTGTPETLRQMRDSIVDGLANVLGGDYLSAEYLLLHLLSQVYHRSDTMPVGDVSLNIFTGDTLSHEESVSLVSRLAEAVQSLLPFSHLMPLSRDYLNKGPLYPRKDHEKNRLVTGSLQLARGTYLILDETAMSTGDVTGVAIENIGCLRGLMDQQKVEYDFTYYRMSYVTDIPVLIISEKKSKIFPADIVLPLWATPDISSFCTENSDIARWRHFLSSVRNVNHTMDPSIQKIVEDDIAEARQKNSALTQETFHRWLTLARLVSLSYGESSLSLERWQIVREMEDLREERLGNVVYPYCPLPTRKPWQGDKTEWLKEHRRTRIQPW